MTGRGYMKEQITIEELLALEPGSYLLYDMRDRYSFDYGAIPGAEHKEHAAILEAADSLPKDMPVIICCKSGLLSDAVAEELRTHGVQAMNLQGGYYGYLMQSLHFEADKAKQVQHSIHKKFHKEIWSRFTAALDEYRLLQPGDKVAVCISGGKDSMLMALLFQELQKHSRFPFEVVYLVMDPGYSPKNREVIERNARTLGLPITVFETDIFSSVLHIEKSPCYICARMRRGHLYNKAKELGCNKIALGHHFNDVIETTVLGMFFGSQLQAMLPKLHSTNFAGMELIRPLYCIHEDSIIAWRRYNDLEFIQCACRFTENCAICDNGGGGSKRQEVKTLLRRLKRDNPNIEKSIFNSIHAVSLDTMIGYKTHGELHSFLEGYDEKRPVEEQESE